MLREVSVHVDRLTCTPSRDRYTNDMYSLYDQDPVRQRDGETDRLEHIRSRLREILEIVEVGCSRASVLGVVQPEPTACLGCRRA
jgi:hypothetical protein